MLMYFLEVQARVIKFHPKVPGVWINAASWEFDHNLDATAARDIMECGLRICPHSEEFWVEYLRMELTYLNKLKARKVALGTLVCNKHKANDNENTDLYMSLDKNRDNDDVAEVVQAGEMTGEDLFRYPGLSMIRIVYNRGVEALACSFSLRTRFIKLLEATDFDHSDDLRREILADMERDFSKEPEYWDWLARTEITHSKGNEIVLPHFKKAIQALKIFSSQRDYLDKLVELSVACLSRDGGSDDGFSLASAIIELLFQTDGIPHARTTYKRFLALPHPGLVFYKNCIELETNHALTGDKDSLVEARKLYEAALATYKQDVCLWQNYHSLEIKTGTSEATNSVYWRAKKQLKDKIILLSSANY